MASGLKGCDPSKFKASTGVRVVSRGALEQFLATGKLHDKLHPDQLAFAGQAARVVRPTITTAAICSMN